LDPSGLEKRQAVGCCKHGNETSKFTRWGNLDTTSNSQYLKEDSSPER